MGDEATFAESVLGSWAGQSFFDNEADLQKGTRISNASVLIRVSEADGPGDCSELGFHDFSIFGGGIFGLGNELVDLCLFSICHFLVDCFAEVA